MRIVCPSCAAEYDVPAFRLTPRKVVRCARCGGEWMAVHEAAESVPPLEPPESPSTPQADVTAPLPAVTAMDRLAASPARPPSRAALIGAWIMTCVVLVGAVAAVVVWRADVTRAWPPIGRILPPTGDTIPQPAHTLGKQTE